MAKLPASAPPTPPDTGTSNHCAPQPSASCCAILRVAAGSILEKSTNTCLWLIAAAMPCSENITSVTARSEEHTSELQSRPHLVCRLLLEKKKKRLNEARAEMSLAATARILTND